MVWSTPLTAVANAPLTAAQWNASVRDNLLATAVAKATTSGNHFAAASANAVAERISSITIVSTSETTTSTSYADLATVGPAATVIAGGCALVLWSATLSNSNVNAESYVAIDVSGATTGAAVDAVAIRFTSATANASLQSTYAQRFTTSPGTSVFTQKYRVSSGTGTFLNRRTSIWPY